MLDVKLSAHLSSFYAESTGNALMLQCSMRDIVLQLQQYFYIFLADYGAGYGGGGGGYSGGSYSGGRSRIDDIDNFDNPRNRRMNPAEQAIDKVTSAVKDLWNSRPRTYESGGPQEFG